MSTKIEWTDTVWNPTTGCNKVSAGCKNCYAERMHKRLQGMGQAKYQTDFNKGVQTWEDELLKPLSWKKPRMVFVNSMSDLFHEDVPFEFVDKVFAVMALTPQHTYQVLTKRADRMEEYFKMINEEGDMNRWRLASMDVIDIDWASTDFENFPLPNVWLIVSVENQEQLEKRVPHLLRCPAAVRGFSCEPLLGRLDLRNWLMIETDLDGNTRGFGYINWVIAGGESGPGARPMHPDWVRSLRDQCQAAGVPFFFKQWGEWMPLIDNSLQSDKDMDAYLLGEYPVTGSRIQLLKKDGTHYGKVFLESFYPIHPMGKVGKKAAGRLLDGQEWNEFPEAGRNEGGNA